MVLDDKNSIIFVVEIMMQHFSWLQHLWMQHFSSWECCTFLLYHSNLKSAFFSVGDYKNNNLFLVKLGWIFYTRPSNGLWWPRRCLSWPSIGSVEKLKGFSWLKTAFGSFSVFKIVQDLHDRDDPQDPKDLEICIRQTERCDSVLGFKNERKRVFSVQNWF